MNQQTEQAHQNLKKLLLDGRILLNGMPLTANEISSLLQGEQMLYEKATNLDKTQQLATKVKEPPQEENVVPIGKGKK